MPGVLDEILAGLAATFLLFLFGSAWKRVRRQFPRTAPTAAPVAASSETSALVPPIGLPARLSLPGKVSHLEKRCEKALLKATGARRDGDSDQPYVEEYERLQECLRSMAFIESGDVLDRRYRLLSYIGGGRSSVVWKAYADRQDRFVAVKFLRHAYVRDQSVVQQFRYSARLMSEFNAKSVAAVKEDVQQLKVNGADALVYYVLEHIDGVPLDVHLAANPDRRDALIDGLLEVGRCLADAHAKGMVHRDLKPGNILVQPDGTLRLVDFDSVLRLSDRRISHQDVGTFGYSAPEVLNGAGDADVRADIFALARVFAYLYYGRKLPNAYALSVYDLIDLLNCAPVVKHTLQRASAVDPASRYDTMEAFLGELAPAVQEDRDKALPPLETLRQEHTKVGRILRHSFYGTFAAMIVARPLFAYFDSVHLSDRAWVGAFHAVIGSLVWGTLIPAAFLVYLVVFERRLRRTGARYAMASLWGGLGGLLGGILLSVPAVFVTNANTLACLGWLTDVRDPDRLHAALFGTRMMLSYPVTGLLTGLGTGLCLQRGIEVALSLSPHGSGILPVPAKQPLHNPDAGPGFIGVLFRSPAAFLFLLFPFLFSFLVAMALDPGTPAQVLECTIQPNVGQRSFGEGFVHFLGAIGLTIGFFLGVRAERGTVR